MNHYCRLAVLALLALSGACTSRQNDEVVIRYMAWGNPQQLAIERQLCEQFSAQHPGITVRFLQVPASAYQNKMIVMLASRTAPDVMRVDQYVFPSLVGKDYFQALDRFVAEDPDFSLDDYLKLTTDECRVNGVLYGLNVLFGAPIIYYNKTLVTSAGLEDPYALWKKGEWTWDAFLHYAKAMTTYDANGRPKTFGVYINHFPAQLAVIYAFGGDIMDESRQMVVMDRGRARDAWQFLVDLRYKHRVSPSPSQAANAVFGFDSGKLGMTIDWMGLTPRLRETATFFDWDVVPIPLSPGGTTVVKGNQIVMNRDSRHQDAAWQFMKFLTSESTERLLYIQLRRSFPTRKDLAYSEEFLRSELPPYQMEVFVESVGNGRTLPITPRWNEWTSAFNSGIDSLMAGVDTDVDKALKEATRRANDALAVREGL